MLQPASIATFERRYPSRLLPALAILMLFRPGAEAWLALNHGPEEFA